MVVANSLVIANWFVAVGTVALAAGTLIVALVTRSTSAATGKLAAETRDLVAATEKLSEVSAEEVELSRRAIQAGVKPQIVDWPAENRRVRFDRGEDALIVVPAHNVGATALIQGVTMNWNEPVGDRPSTIRQGWPTVLAVGPGGETEAQFPFGKGEADRLIAVEKLGKFWVQIEYTDAAGNQREVTRFDIYWDRDTDNWRVFAVSFRAADMEEPYAEARPANR